MIKPNRLYLACTFLLSVLISSQSYAQFSGMYAPANWSTIQVSGANGSVNANNAPTSIALTGPDNVNNQAWTRYQISIQATGSLSFDWSVVHQDPGYDGFGYWLNGTYVELTDMTATGSTNITVSPGDDFAFYGETFDGCCGTFVATISNFTAPSNVMNDAGVAEIMNPTEDFCADSAEVLVKIQNYGANQITPVTVNWTVNGMTQTPVTYNGTLDTLGGSGPDTAIVSLGNYYFLDSNSIVVWTSMPNNVNDTTNINDTMSIDLVAPDPEISLGDTTICEGGFVILNAEPGFVSYIWSNGSTAQQIQVLQGGTYSVTVTDAIGCQDSAISVVTEFAAPNVDLGGDISACDSIELNSGVIAPAYAWSTGATTQTIYATVTGFYSVTATSPQGCTGSDQILVTIYESPTIDLGPNISLCVETGETAALAAGSGFAMYQWSNGETTPNIIVGGFGGSVGSQNFSVQVTNDNGCTGADTVRVNFISCWPTGIDENQKESLLLYPNPTSTSINVVVANSKGALDIKLFDLTGREVGHYIDQNASGLGTSIDLSHLAPSSYIIMVRDDEGKTHKAIVQVQ